jgi:hypothetical protein
MIPMKKTSTTKPKKMGRPTKEPNEKKSFLYAVRLTPVEKNVLLRESKKYGQSQTELFRTILNSYLEART